MTRNLNLGLTAEQKLARQGGLGGSDANTLMSGDAERIHRLWLEKTGQEESEDLSRVLPVQMGSWTEELNRYWFELTTGRTFTHEGESRRSMDFPFMGATLDGLTTTEAGEPALFEAKHVNQYSKVDEVVQRYMGQIHHGMTVTGLSHAVLSVFIGTFTYEFFEVELDWLYAAQLIDRETAFWRCVEAKEPPPGWEPVKAPCPPAALRTVDMTGSNAWASHAADWIANKAPAAKFEKAAKELKALVETDVGEATGHGIIIKRSKANALSIKEHSA